MNNILNNQLVTTSDQPLTMSSMDIAELLGKRHDKVKQSIERLNKKNLIGFTPLGEVNNLGQSLSVYHLNKRDSYIVVAQLSPEFTGAIIDRWQELEQKQLEHNKDTQSIASLRNVLPDMLVSVNNDIQVATVEVERARKELETNQVFLDSNVKIKHLLTQVDRISENMTVPCKLEYKEINTSEEIENSYVLNYIKKTRSITTLEVILTNIKRQKNTPFNVYVRRGEAFRAIKETVLRLEKAGMLKRSDFGQYLPINNK